MANHKDIHLYFDLDVPSHADLLAKIDLIRCKYRLSYTQAFMFYLFPITAMWTKREDTQNTLDKSTAKELHADMSQSHAASEKDMPISENGAVKNGGGYNEEEGLAQLLKEVFPEDGDRDIES